VGTPPHLAPRSGIVDVFIRLFCYASATFFWEAFMSTATVVSMQPNAPEVSTPLQQLMYGLIYPAVLGTGIVLVGVRAAHHSSAINALLDPSIQLGLMAGLFFCASFDSAFYWPVGQQGHYTRRAFGVDVVEVILMFVCFHYLRLFEDPVKLVAPFLPFAYGTLAADVLLQFGWRKLVGLDWKYRWLLRLGIAVVLVFGAVLGQRSSWVNVVISLAVGVFVIIYVVSDPRYKKQ
jgi:hypothetical protein